MPAPTAVLRKTLNTLETYWMLIRIVVPITILTELLSQMGAIEALAPAFAPVMSLVGLPPELGLAWLSGMLIGIWGAVPLVFVLVPVDSLSVADITIFSALLLFAHGLPVEQRIIQKAGPGMIVTTLLRVAGGVFYAFLLHFLFDVTGWLSTTAHPTWISMNATSDRPGFFCGLFETMLSMLIILLTLSWGLEMLKITGLMNLMTALSPVLRLAGIRGEAGQFTAVGLFLGVSYGGGLLIREARSGAIAPRQVFISCIFMGFAHSIIEDTVIVVALGADLGAVLGGRLVFGLAAIAAIAGILRYVSDEKFFTWVFRSSTVKAVERYQHRSR